MVPDVVLDLYHRVPRDCFISGVPFPLRGHEDNEVIPSFDHTVAGPDGVQAKWIRFCDFLPFIDACRSYWMDSMVHPLYVYLMPYTPLRDAYHLHECIENADQLPVQPLVLDQDVQPYGDDHENAAVPPQLRHGRVDVAPGAIVTFTLVNYRLLWSKAHKFSIMSYLNTRLEECMRRLDVCANLLRDSAPRVSIDQLLLNTDDARRRLAIALLEAYGNGELAADPHDALLTMYPDIHDEVYQDQCFRCHEDLYPADLDPAATSSRLESAMDDLRYEDQDIDADLPICQAEYNLMDAEGAVEFHDYNMNVRTRFSNSQSRVATALKPTCDYVRESISCHTLVGVLAHYEDANPDEGN